MTRQKNQIVYSDIKDYDSLLSKYRDLDKTYSYVKNASELGILLLCPVVAGKSVLQKIK
jgi:hypothetical protein